MFAVALWPASMDNTEGATPIEKLAGEEIWRKWSLRRSSLRLI